MQDAVVIQRPGSTRPGSAKLVLLFHGVGSDAENLRPLGDALAETLKQAWIVSVRSPDASELGGWQWFSVRAITESNRPVRVAATMPRFVETISQWQREAGVDAASTTLIGFSQGAIMALESTQLPQPPADHVVAIAGRFAQPPLVAPLRGRLHLMHGEQDRVMPVALAVEAAERLQTLGTLVTLDRFAGLGHGIDGRVALRIVERLAQDGDGTS